MPTSNHLVGAVGRVLEDSGTAHQARKVIATRAVHDGGAVQDPVEHCHREHAIASEGAIPTVEVETGGQDHRASLMAPPPVALSRESLALDIPRRHLSHQPDDRVLNCLS